MRSRSKFVCFLLVLLITWPVATAAQTDCTPEPGDVGVFFDPAGALWCRGGIQPGITFEVFVVSFDLEGDIFGYEFSLTNPVGPFILSRTTNPAAALDVGPGDDNWIVGTGVCIDGSGPVWLLMESVLLFSPQNDLLFCIGPAQPSSPGLGNKPGWLACDESIHPFGAFVPNNLGIHPDGCAVGNDTHGGCGVLAAGDDSWGAHKARFQN